MVGCMQYLFIYLFGSMSSAALFLFVVSFCKWPDLDCNHNIGMESSPKYFCFKNVQLLFFSLKQPLHNAETINIDGCLLSSLNMQTEENQARPDRTGHQFLLLE